MIFPTGSKLVKVSFGKCRHWGTDDWPPFAHYSEIGYMMPVAGPSKGLSGFWEEFDAAYDAGGFFMLIVHPFLTGRLAR